jgi:hypothetical protein
MIIILIAVTSASVKNIVKHNKVTDIIITFSTLKKQRSLRVVLKSLEALRHIKKAYKS